MALAPELAKKLASNRRRSQSPAKALLSSALCAALALGFRIAELGEYAFDDAQREFGFPLRTYRRHLQRLRAAGMVLESPNATCKSVTYGVGYVRFVRFDQGASLRSAANIES